MGNEHTFFMDGLDFEEREIYLQTLCATLPLMTDMQQRCLLMSVIGLEQKAIGEILNVSQSNVSRHFINALEIIKRNRSEFL